MSLVTHHISDVYSRAVRNNILQSLLLHGTLTRREIGQIIPLSGAAVTNHTRWLARQKLIDTQKKRVETSMKPVEDISIRGDLGLCLAMHLHPSEVRAELVALDGSVRQAWSEPVREPTQHGLLRALGQAAQAIQGRKVDGTGLALSGFISPKAGLIFGVEGIEGPWEPCQPGEILPALRSAWPLEVWTDVACKVRGLAGRLKIAHHLAYFEYCGRSFRIATMQDGRVHLGAMGSTSSRLHQSVCDEGPECYCGRRGCLANLLARGRLTDQMLAKGLKRLLESFHIEHVGLEWSGQTQWLHDLLEQQGVHGVHSVSDQEQLAAQGLRALTAEMALQRKLEQCPD